LASQLELLAVDDFRLKLEAGRIQPRLWVRKFVIWKNRESVIREFMLRPGLNIVWSPDPADQKGKTTKALGHGSGKTLFCRLLRYCLGEDRFASDVLRHQITYAFTEGWVGAEVVIDGTPWAVLRPIGSGRKHYAVPNIELADLISTDHPATGIDPLLEAIETSVLTTAVSDLIRSGSPATAWPLSLAWLTRDQECRFDHVLDWRSATSESDSPARSLSKAELLAALRVLIGAIDPAEYRIREEIGALERQQEESERELHHREWEAKRLRSRLISETGVEAAEVPAEALGAEFLRHAATKLLGRASNIPGGNDQVEIDARREESKLARERGESFGKELAAIDARIPLLEASIQRLKGQLPGASAAVASATTPICPICEVPIDQALAEGCKLSHVMPDLLAVKSRFQQIRDDLAKEEPAVDAEKDKRADIQQQLDAVLRDIEQLSHVIETADRAEKQRTDEWYRARRLVDDAKRLAELLASSDADLDHSVSKQIEGKRDRLAAFRDKQAPVFQKATTFFDSIIRRLIPDAKGEVTLDGNGLHLHVHLGGDRSTAAIDSLKVVAFDLAVMCMSIEGETPLPAFFVHDSPREADLGLSVYERLFDVVHALEPDDRTKPLFQYIVTTTTPPPRQFRKKPWLAGTLRGTPAEERLLKIDL
jgi:hypothetical protein